MLRREWISTGWMVGKSAYTYREPYGVIGVITPWNYPFLLVADTVAAALFTGNSVVVKPSEFTPFSAMKLRDLCREAGLADGLVEIVTGDDHTGMALVESGVDKVVFSGSSHNGRKVMAAAARSLTPVALELSGKDPAIVLDDADLERAARGVVYGAFYNAGQTCISTERVLVMDGIYDEFVERVTELTRDLRAGTEGDYDVGPMVTPQQLRVVESHLADALARGARVTVGGERLAPESNVFLPTVLVDVDQSMRVVWEETFGPLLPVMRVRDEEEAVRLANVSPFGLFASVWTEDREHGEEVAERLKAGGVSVNDTLSHYGVPGLPMGGVGESGFGRRRGAAGLEELCRTRSVLVHRTGLSRELWWFPYTERGTRLMRALLGYRQASGLGRIWDVMHRLFARGRR
jgi:acyl-CoA reductase-like NAD-dependent aldehyde dehydrogenase